MPFWNLLQRTPLAEFSKKLRRNRLFMKERNYTLKNEFQVAAVMDTEDEAEEAEGEIEKIEMVEVVVGITAEEAEEVVDSDECTVNFGNYVKLSLWIECDNHT